MVKPTPYLLKDIKHYNYGCAYKCTVNSVTFEIKPFAYYVTNQSQIKILQSNILSKQPENKFFAIKLFFVH